MKRFYLSILSIVMLASCKQTISEDLQTVVAEPIKELKTNFTSIDFNEDLKHNSLMYQEYRDKKVTLEHIIVESYSKDIGGGGKFTLLGYAYNPDTKTIANGTVNNYDAYLSDEQVKLTDVIGMHPKDAVFSITLNGEAEIKKLKIYNPQTTDFSVESDNRFDFKDVVTIKATFVGKVDNPYLQNYVLENGSIQLE